MDDAKPKQRASAAVPSSRLSRMASLTGLAGRVAGNLVADGSRHWIKGQRHDAANRQVVLDIFVEATEPLRTPGDYDFGRSDLAQRIHQRGMAISSTPEAWHTPPADVLFLHRKMGGLFMLAAQLGACVDVHAIFSRYRELL